MILTVTLNPAIDKLYCVQQDVSGTVMRVETVSNTPGGKGINVAKVASLLGETACATGLVGGFNGQFIRARLHEQGVREAFCEVKGETRCCVNVRDRSTGQHTEYLEPGQPVIAAELAAFERAFKELLSQSSIVCISGSAPAGTPAGMYGKLITACRTAGVPVIVDTSGAWLVESVNARPTLIKPNTDEIAQVLGHSVHGFAAVIEAAKRLHADGIAYVAVSLGAQGSVLCCDAGVFRAAPPDITPVNTVGCGDSMVAGFAAALLRGYPAAETLRYATAVSAANALELATGHIDPANIPQLLEATEVERIG